MVSADPQRRVTVAVRLNCTSPLITFTAKNVPFRSHACRPVSRVESPDQKLGNKALLLMATELNMVKPAGL